jgi:hypothetical protein
VNRPVQPPDNPAPANAEPGQPEPTEADPQAAEEPPSDDGQPGGEQGSEGQSADDEEADVPPADVDLKLAAAVIPDRDRVRYKVRFIAPRIARLEIPLQRTRTPLEAGPQLAATR